MDSDDVGEIVTNPQVRVAIEAILSLAAVPVLSDTTDKYPSI